jgi:hypothetical protein
MLEGVTFTLMKFSLCVYATQSLSSAKKRALNYQEEKRRGIAGCGARENIYQAGTSAGEPFLKRRVWITTHVKKAQHTQLLV